MGLKSCKIDTAAKTLTIVMDLEDPRPSASGKTMVIASSSGNVRTEANVAGRVVTVGVNAYFTPAPK